MISMTRVHVINAQEDYENGEGTDVEGSESDSGEKQKPTPSTPSPKSATDSSNFIFGLEFHPEDDTYAIPSTEMEGNNCLLAFPRPVLRI